MLHSKVSQPNDLSSCSSMNAWFTELSERGKPKVDTPTGGWFQDQTTKCCFGVERKHLRPRQKPYNKKSEFNAICCHWYIPLLLFWPIGAALWSAMTFFPAQTHMNGLYVFLANIVAIVPLAAIVGQATSQLGNYLGEGPAGLLNASFW